MAHPPVDSAHLDAVCALLREGGMPLLSSLALHDRLESGELRGFFTRTDEGVAVTVVNEGGRWRQVVAAHGPEPVLLRALEGLRESSDALIWDEESLPIDGTRLDELGYRLLVRQVFTQELARVPLDEPEPGELDIGPLEAPSKADARSLFARTHAMSVEGLYATLPDAPTVERCAAAFDEYLGGGQGPVVPAACVVIRNGPRVVGVICCAATEKEGTGILLGLAVDPSERGRGLSRVLVRRAQRGLKASGFDRMLFLTTDRNTPVHHLFTLDEIIDTETSPARLWLRDPPPSLRPR